MMIHDVSWALVLATNGERIKSTKDCHLLIWSVNQIWQWKIHNLWQDLWNCFPIKLDISRIFHKAVFDCRRLVGSFVYRGNHLDGGGRR